MKMCNYRGVAYVNMRYGLIWPYQLRCMMSNNSHSNWIVFRNRDSHSHRAREIIKTTLAIYTATQFDELRIFGLHWPLVAHFSFSFVRSRSRIRLETSIVHSRNSFSISYVLNNCQLLGFCSLFLDTRARTQRQHAHLCLWVGNRMNTTFSPCVNDPKCIQTQYYTKHSHQCVRITATLAALRFRTVRLF